MSRFLEARDAIAMVSELGERLPKANQRGKESEPGHLTFAKPRIRARNTAASVETLFYRPIMRRIMRMRVTMPAPGTLAVGPGV